MEDLSKFYEQAILAIINDNYISSYSLSAYLSQPVYIWTDYKPLLSAPIILYFLESYKSIKDKKLILFWNKRITPLITKEQYKFLLEKLNLSHQIDSTGIYVKHD